MMERKKKHAYMLSVEEVNSWKWMYWHIAEEIEIDRRNDEITLPSVPSSPKAIINKLLTQSQNIFLMHRPW